uniref:Seminal fluid protein HACP044 n=1 Tax=Heliconius erato TaxID=33431 RepID=D9HQ52_HELEA|nr:seminal fluid protein HACP044 [Heliconius erato]
MKLKNLSILLLCVVVDAQRPFYAGKRPIGYPAVSSPATANEYHGQRLPIEANGDINLIKRIEALPVDQQPFWYLNWRQYEDLRNNPQTYSLRPSIFSQN